MITIPHPRLVRHESIKPQLHGGRGDDLEIHVIILTLISHDFIQNCTCTLTNYYVSYYALEQVALMLFHLEC